MAPKSTEFRCFFYFLRRMFRKYLSRKFAAKRCPPTTSCAPSSFPGQGCTASLPPEIQLAWSDETCYRSHHPKWRRYSGSPARGRRHAGGFLGIHGLPGRTSRDPAIVPRARAVCGPRHRDQSRPGNRRLRSRIRERLHQTGSHGSPDCPRAHHIERA